MSNWLNDCVLPLVLREEQMITVTCNGKLHEMEEGNTLLDLLAKLELTEQRMAIEMNRKIIPKSTYHQTALQPGDKIEIVHAIGGG